jgi:hypothetical protein
MRKKNNKKIKKKMLNNLIKGLTLAEVKEDEGTKIKVSSDGVEYSDGKTEVEVSKDGAEAKKK